MARGDPAGFWLIFVGLARTTERDRVASPRVHIWTMACNTMFDSTSHIVTNTDGAATDVHQHTGIDEHHSVNHEVEEWARREKVSSSVETGDRKCTHISTNYLDSQWQKVQEPIPRGVEVKPVANVRINMDDVRSNDG